MHATRVEPEGSAPAVARRRLREMPSLWLPLTVCAAAIVLRVLDLLRPAYGLTDWATFIPLWVIAAASLLRLVHLPHFRRFPSVPSDSAEPVTARWLDAPRGLGSLTAARQVHLLDPALRIAGPVASWRDVPFLLGVGAVGAVVMVPWFGVPAALAIAWAFGFPRPARIAVDVPWESIARADREGRDRFRIVRSGGEGDLVLETMAFDARLASGLADRLGDRLHGEGAALPRDALPAVLRPVAGDEEAGVAEIAVRRLGFHWSLVAALACLAVAGAAYVAGRAAGIPALQHAALVLVFAAVVLSVIGGQGRQGLWRGGTPEPGDTPDPISVAWIHRPGWPGPRPQQAHLRPEGLRVVAHEWEMWDTLVIGAVGLAAFPVAGGFSVFPVAGGIAMFVAVAVAQTAGLPRWRRVAVDLLWEDITSVEIVALRGSFEIRTSLAPPADRLRLNAKFSARERLTGALRERLGDRVRIEESGRSA